MHFLKSKGMTKMGLTIAITGDREIKGTQQRRTPGVQALTMKHSISEGTWYESMFTLLIFFTLYTHLDIYMYASCFKKAK
jgi:hypothetical protein